MSSRKLFDTKYVIVMDAGSSGTRSFLYSIRNLDDGSLPEVVTSTSVSFKNKPGMSSYYDFVKKKVNIDDLFEDNVEDLLKKTLKQLKTDLHDDFGSDKDVSNYIKSLEIPIYIQATAGMRLLPEKVQNEILSGICENLFEKNDDWPFKVYPNKCLGHQVDIIDGQMEGVYGWLSLNYQLDTLDKASENDLTYGFMDMGGASQQIAFSPTTSSGSQKGSVLKLTEDKQFDIFVKTWLGFGTNQARKRYLQQLIMLNLENNNDFEDDDYTNRVIYDNCLPLNAAQDFNFNGKEFEIKGLGDFENCERMIYPLLLKHIPCGDADTTEGECLFNGVTVPKIDFKQDRFVGISEYYYLTKDLFDMHNTPINFITLEKKIKDFCETDYSELKVSYNELPEDLLLNSCFKLNWLTNVLHEGFQFPRLDIDKIDSSNNYIPFMTMGEVNDMELSWTMGKALMYASSLKDSTVGYYPEAGSPVFASLDASTNSNKLKLDTSTDAVPLLAVAWHIIWFFLFTLPFFAFKILLISLVIQIVVNHLKRNNILLSNTGFIMRTYNSHKNKNFVFKALAKLSSFSNAVIRKLNAVLETQWNRHYPYQEYPLKTILLVNSTNNISYDELELGATKQSHSDIETGSLNDSLGQFSSKDQIFSTENNIRATSSYSNLNSSKKGDHVLRTAFSLSDFKTYE
ncbi:hypothetical protein QEN19_004099 [Hanseniaspora menglaensis]